MKLPSVKVVLLAPMVVFAVFYVLIATVLLSRTPPSIEAAPAPSEPLDIAILGASGTAGDGILKAALASDHIGSIEVITRRITPRMEAGVAAGKVTVTRHMDYLDYSAVLPRIAEVDAVYWAIGLSSLGVDEETYSMIHVDFPVAFVNAWASVSQRPDTSFHYLSSSDISDDSSAMWAQQKIRAEKSLFSFAQDTNMRVIAYRPDYIGPTEEEEHLGQALLFGFFRPVGAAIKATEIGSAMIDISLRGAAIENGTKLTTGKLLMHSRAL